MTVKPVDSSYGLVRFSLRVFWWLMWELSTTPTRVPLGGSGTEMLACQGPGGTNAAPPKKDGGSLTLAVIPSDDNCQTLN